MEPTVTVICDACSCPTRIEENRYGAYCCMSRSCGLILRPRAADKKYVRAVCKDRATYYYVHTSEKYLECKCCKATFEISDVIAETRNKQKVYTATRKTPLNYALLTNYEDTLKDRETKLQELDKERRNLIAQLNFEINSSNSKNEEIEVLKSMLEGEKEATRLKNEIVVKKENENESLLKKVSDLEDLLEEIKKASERLEERFRAKEEEFKELKNKMSELNRATMLKKEITKDTENEFLLKNISEFLSEEILAKADDDNQRLQEQIEAKEQEISEMKGKMTELNQENNKLSIKILEETINNAETQKNLEILALEKQQLVGKLATVNALFQSAIITGDRQVEQIKTLMTTNLNLSAALAKQQKDEEVEKETADEKAQEEEPPKVIEEPKKEESKTISCNVCQTAVPKPEDCSMFLCESQGCPGNGNVILTPTPKNHRYVRRVCKNSVFFTLIRNSEKIILCHCCNKEYNITDVVIEMRNDQKVYKAVLTALPEDEVADLKNKLKTQQKQYTTFLGEFETKLQYLDDKVTQKEERIQKVEEENKEYSEQLELIRNQNTCLKDINKMMMKKMKKEKNLYSDV